ncbi:hypothetical protein ISS07_03210 [Candidatus Woesearchaeota archaeon]|nr:hypothetical protein [Candidatus Woesearchaeota archaeon]
MGIMQNFEPEYIKKIEKITFNQLSNSHKPEKKSFFQLLLDRNKTRRVIR